MQTRNKKRQSHKQRSQTADETFLSLSLRLQNMSLSRNNGLRKIASEMVQSTAQVVSHK